MHFPLTIPSNILSTSTSDNLDLFSTQSFDNVLERFVHTMMQEGQTLEDYVLQVKALDKVLVSLTSQQVLIVWFLKGLESVSMCNQVLQGLSLRV